MNQQRKNTIMAILEQLLPLSLNFEGELWIFSI